MKGLCEQLVKWHVHLFKILVNITQYIKASHKEGKCFKICSSCNRWLYSAYLLELSTSFIHSCKCGVCLINYQLSASGRMPLSALIVPGLRREMISSTLSSPLSFLAKIFLPAVRRWIECYIGQFPLNSKMKYANRLSQIQEIHDR